MDYGDKFYKKYQSAHAVNIYGKIKLNDIKKQFPVWQNYFGKFLKLDKNINIIDLGCGNGGFVYWLKNSGFENVSGVDISKEQIELSKELGIDNIFLFDLKEFLKNKNGIYDVIFAKDVLEHFNKEEIIDVLDIIYGSLKNGGELICQTVNAENLLWGRLRYGDFTHELAFTKESISQVFKGAGFKDIKVYSQQPVIHSIKSLVRYMLWKCIEYCLHLYLFIETGSGKGIFTQNIIISAKK